MSFIDRHANMVICIATVQTVTIITKFLFHMLIYKHNIQLKYRLAIE